MRTMAGSPEAWGGRCSGPWLAACVRAGIFLILTFSKLFLKLTRPKVFFHPVTPLPASARVARQAHAVARQLCHAGEAERAKVTWPRDCRATCNGAAALLRHPAWRDSTGPTDVSRPPFFLLLPLPEPSTPRP
jgi:hypothetical protein